MQNQMSYIEDLIIEKLTGNISDKDNDYLEEMIHSDQQMADLWQEHQSLYSLLSENYDREKAWQYISHSIKGKPRYTRLRQFFVTLTIVIVMVFGGIAFFSKDPVLKTSLTPVAPRHGITLSTGQETFVINKSEAGTFSTNVVAFNNKNGELTYSAKDTATTVLNVPQGMDYKLTLSDSTKVWVNAATKLSFPLQFTGNFREITLAGEAYFEVSKNKSKPFIIHTAEMTVQVYGTSFNLRAYKDEATQASLVEGSIKASTSTRQLVLTPGEAVKLEKGILHETDFDVTNVLAWMKGYYYFDNEMISFISRTVDRWFGYQFAYAEPSIASIHFTGALEKTQSLEVFLSRISSSANLKYTLMGTMIRLERK
jgi:transmembrane sensor